MEDVLGDNNNNNSPLGGNNNNKVPMEKVVMLIWQFRDDPSVITFMARFMTKVCQMLFCWLLARCCLFVVVVAVVVVKQCGGLCFCCCCC